MADQGVSRDLGFGVNGRVDLAQDIYSVDQHVQVLDDGTILAVNGSAFAGRRLHHFTPTGSQDPLFPSGKGMLGNSTLASIDFPDTLDEPISWLDQSGTSFTVYRQYWASLGSDTSFNGIGWAVTAFVGSLDWSYPSMIRLADGSYAISGVAFTVGGGFTEVVRLSSDGSRLLSFGTFGMATFPEFRGSVVGATASGQLLFSALDATGNFTNVTRVTATGQFDTTYGTSGFAPSPTGDLGERQRVLVDPTGAAIVARFSVGPPGMRIHRLLPNGTVDLAFGVSGVTSISSSILAPSLSSFGALEPRTIRRDAAGRIIVSASYSPDFGVLVVLGANGIADASFGVGGMAVISQDLRVRAIDMGDDGTIASIGILGNRGVVQRSTDSRPWPPTSPPPTGVGIRLARFVGGVGFQATWGTVTNPDPEVIDDKFGYGLVRLDDQHDFGGDVRANTADTTFAGYENLRHGTYRFRLLALNKFGAGAPTDTTVVIPRWNRTVTPVAPIRVFDSRPGSTTVDGVSAGGGLLAAGSTSVVHLWGRGGILPSAQAAGVNITAVAPSANGFVTAYPCWAGRPNAASINYLANTTVASGSIATIDMFTGDLCVYTSAATHLVIDVSSQYEPSTPFYPFTPARLVDSRPTGVTVDGVGAAIGLRPAGSTTVVHLNGRDRVPANAVAVAVNLTAVAPAGNGFMTMYPCTAARPAASNINYSAGRTASNSAIAVPDVNGDVCVYTSAPTQLIVDASGALFANSEYSTPPAARLLDTRPTGTTVDGQHQRGGTLAPGTTTVLHVADRGLVTSDPTAVSLNITAVAPAANGFITAYRCDIVRPNTSNINYVAGRTIANFSVAELDDHGDICIYNSASMHMVVDVNGTFRSSGV